MDTDLINTNIEYEVKYGHGEGHTDCDFNPSGGTVLTGGSDGECRLWQLNHLDDDPESFPVGTEVFAICITGKKYYVASDSSDVKEYLVQDGTYVGSVVRFSTNVYHLDVSKDGQLLAAGGGDFEIKLINLEDSSHKSLKEHEAPILSLAIDPEKEYLASSSCDGTIRMWNIETQKCVKIWDGHHEKSNDFLTSKTLARISWHPKGHLIAIPDKNGVVFYSRDDWSQKDKMSHPQFQNVSICAFSSSGNLFASSNPNGTVLIFMTENLVTPVSIFVHEDSTQITSLKFNPQNESQIMMCDASGKFSCLKISKLESGTEKINVVVDDLYGVLSDDEEFTEENFVRDMQKKNPKVLTTTIERVMTGDDEDEEPFVKQKKGRVQLEDDDDDSYGAPADDGLMTGDDDDVPHTKPTDFSLETLAENDLEDDGGIDIGRIKALYDPLINPQTPESEEDEDRNEDGAGDAPADTRKVRVVDRKEYLQPPFQPSSTPKHLEQRFMVWNDTGIIRAYHSEEDDTIDVEFHDTAVHHSINLINNYNYTIGDLSAEALVLSNQRSGEEPKDTSCKIFCINLGTWDESNKEWKVDLPQDEFSECITLGLGFIAVATDKWFIRLFSVGGIQMFIFSIHGSPICLAAQEKSLAITYHNGPGAQKSQNLLMNIFKIDMKTDKLEKQNLPNPVPVAISPESSLSWMGFSDEGSPTTVDSKGVVRVYKSIIGNTWMPIADLKQMVSNQMDNYFVIGVSEIQEQMRCIFCKGSKYPSVIPRPQVTTVQFEIPFCEKTTTKGKFEEKHIRAKMSNALLEKLLVEGYAVDPQLKQNLKIMNESLLRIFAMAIGANCEALALEISLLMPNGKTVESAIRYALSKRCTALADKLREVAFEKEQGVQNGTSRISDPSADERFDGHPSRNSVVSSDPVEESIMRPKPMSFKTKDKSRVYQEEDSQDVENSDEEFSLRPKTTGIKKRVLEEENDDPEEISFKLFYADIKDSLESDYPDAGTEELLEIAMEGFSSLDADEKRRWLKNAEAAIRKKTRIS